MALKILVDGVDIYDDVEIISCIHEMHAAVHADMCYLELLDTENRWHKWAISHDLPFEIEYSGIRSGKMHLILTKEQQGTMILRASSCPQEGFQVHKRSWEAVRLSRVLSDIALPLGLTVEMYGITDWLYSFLHQNEPDYEFLYRRLALEGYSYLIFDGKLIVYSRDWLLSREISGDISISTGDEFDYVSSPLYNSAIVECGDIEGRAGIEIVGQPLKSVISSRVNTLVEASRFARNLLLDQNDQSGIITISTGLLTYTPTAAVNVASGRKWDGTATIAMVRNDYVKEKSKVVLRRWWQ